MKIQGREIKGRNIEVVVFRRPVLEDGSCGNIAFKAEAIPDYKEFDKMCPQPEPPEILRPGGVRTSNLKDKRFLAALDIWASKKTAYVVLKSLQATEGLEWENVDMKNPETWSLYRKELTDSDFTDNEVAKIIEIVGIANSMDDGMLDAAREDFLAEEARQVKLDSQTAEV